MGSYDIVGGGMEDELSGGHNELDSFLVGGGQVFELEGDDQDDIEDDLADMGYSDEEIELVLDGAFDIMGARRRRGGRSRRGRSRSRRRGRGRGRATPSLASPVRAAVAARIAETAAIIKPAIPTKSRQWPLGFFNASVLIGTTVDIFSRPQVIFQPQRLTVVSSIASNFQINDIRVGQKSQLINSEPLPAETFTQDAVGIVLRMDTAKVSQDIVLRVTNVGLVNSPFSGSLIGEIVE